VTGTGLPSSSWNHLFSLRQANSISYHLQISASFYNNELYYRSISNRNWSANWIKIATSESNTFTGVQNLPGNGIWSSNGRVGIGTKA